MATTTWGSRFLLLTLLIILPAPPVAPARNAKPPENGYTDGDEVFVECKNLTTGVWEPGPLCRDTNTRFSILVGVDSFKYCALEVSSISALDNLKALINQSASWQCRVPSLKLPPSYAKEQPPPTHIPFSITFIGAVDPASDHVKMNTRMNYIFHIFQGRIVGAAVYPVLDRLQRVKTGSLVSLHGSVVWQRHLSLKSTSISSQGGPHYERQLAMASALAATMITLTACTLLFLFVLKPTVIRRCMKKD